MSLTNDLILQMNVTDAPMQLTTERFFIHDETLQDAPFSHRQSKLVVSRLIPKALTTPCRKQLGNGFYYYSYYIISVRHVLRFSTSKLLFQ